MGKYHPLGPMGMHNEVVMAHDEYHATSGSWKLEGEEHGPEWVEGAELRTYYSEKDSPALIIWLSSAHQKKTSFLLARVRYIPCPSLPWSFSDETKENLEKKQGLV